jgi:hypothetical protein
MVKVMVVRLLRSGPGRGDSGRIHYFQKEAPWPSLSSGWNPTGRIYPALWESSEYKKMSPGSVFGAVFRFGK